MKITVESTSEVVTLVGLKDGNRAGSEIMARIWEGETDSGIHVTCLIARIAAKDGQDLSQFERELHETKVPTAEAIQAFPLRLLI